MIELLTNQIIDPTRAQLSENYELHLNLNSLNSNNYGPVLQFVTNLSRSQNRNVMSAHKLSSQQIQLV
jgi:hypothetical protein